MPDEVAVASKLQGRLDHVIINDFSKQVLPFYPLQLGNFVIMRHPKTKRIYIGEVSDIYTKGSSSRYGSVLAADGVSGPFSSGVPADSNG